MGSTLSVTTLQGLTSGVNANQVVIPTGHKIIGTDTGSVYAPGSVIQVVQGIATAITVGTATPTTIVQANITVQQGSKVFVTGCGDMNPANAGEWHYYQIYRDSSAVSQRYIGQSAGISYNLPFSISYVEISGLNAGTYTYSLRAFQGVGTMTYGETGNIQAPTIVLMEIAQ